MLDCTRLLLLQETRITRQTVIAIENHHYNPSLELALKISEFLNNNVENIFILANCSFVNPASFLKNLILFLTIFINS
ncbi:helix-turn-helix transcriptional regulator [Lysinibacillus sp. NPDC093190]|uniref:helix-turn-helix transcriptional regulator n=1 Tax=Lysinibacillus sp. NPDC093190 TaxID=3390575 RepID=UPI003D06F7D4